jgi:transcriptional regulator with XRE-family HTH domain
MQPRTKLFPALLRHWRSLRGMSQLDLALASNVSSRHVSFLETGRSEPSRDMLLRLAAALGVPLRERNELLRAAGFPEVFPEPRFADGLPTCITDAIERMLVQHEPFPMIVIDRGYDILRANDACTRLIARFVVDPAALSSRLNIASLLFDQRLARPFVANWEEVARSFLSRIHREKLAQPGSTVLAELDDRILAYGDVPRDWHTADLSRPSEPTLTLRLRRDDLELAFLTAVTSFSAPQNITVEEVILESYFPLDDRTAAACRALAP